MEIIFKKIVLYNTIFIDMESVIDIIDNIDTYDKNDLLENLRKYKQ